MSSKIHRKKIKAFHEKQKQEGFNKIKRGTKNSSSTLVDTLQGEGKNDYWKRFDDLNPDYKEGLLKKLNEVGDSGLLSPENQLLKSLLEMRKIGEEIFGKE